MIRINLLPVREERRKQDIRQYAVMMVAALAGSVALAAVFHWSLLSDVSEAKATMQQLQQQIDRYGPQLQKVEEYKKTKAQIEKKLEVIEQLKRSRSGPVHVMDEIATHAPEKLWVTRVQTQGRSLTMEGLSLDNELVASFMTALEGSAYFQNVELQKTEAKTVNGFKLNAFAISANITSPGEPTPAGGGQAAATTAALSRGAGR